MHSCPECFQSCHCNGDIDDIDFGEDFDCVHFKQCDPKCDIYEELQRRPDDEGDD